MECVGHVHDEPLHGAVKPGEVLAVFQRVFQAWQYTPLSKGRRGVDVQPKKVPDEPVPRTAIKFELGEEIKLGQHEMAHAQVALKFVEGAEEQAVTHALQGVQQLVNDLGFLRLSRPWPMTQS